MPWCPKCKSEYRAGFTTCSDCGSTLVENLAEPEEPDWETVGPEGFFGQPEEQLTQEEFDDIVETSKALSETADAKNAEKTKRKESMDKANDNRSSGWTLVFLGIVGIIVTILCALEIIPIKVGSPLLVYGVVGGMFVIFLISGIYSFKNAKYYVQKAAEEEELKKEILDWCTSNINPKMVDTLMKITDEPSEAVYLKRFVCIRAIVADKFPNQDDNFVDNLIEDSIFDAVFGEEA